MNPSIFLRRSLTMLGGIALATGITVFFLNNWFNESLLPALGAPQPLGNAIGSMLVVLASYVGVRIVSLAFFRDHAFGQEIRVDELAHQRDRKDQVFQEVARELRTVPAFNEVLRKQLGSVVQQTEHAANDISAQLQTIDSVVERLNAFVANRSAESAELVHDSELRIANKQKMIGQMQEYIEFRISEARADQVRVAQVVKKRRVRLNHLLVW